MGVGIKYSKPLVSVRNQAPCLLHMSHSHTHEYGGAAHLEVGYLTLSASWLSALNCDPCNHAPLTV